MKKPLDFDQNRGVDLHIHSNASDGTYSPLQIIQIADQLGLRAISITDHDTVKGSRIAIASGIPNHIDFITGIEISTKAPAPIKMSGSLHILGYGIDLDCQPLIQALTELQQARSERTPRIIEQLRKMDLPITIEQVEQEVGDGTAGRPHIASVLIKNGVADSIDDAFERFLAKGRPGYVDKYRIDCRRSMDLIHLAGGLPVLAHPCLVPQNQLIRLLDILQPMGLVGIEAYYTEHKSQDVTRYLELAREYNLLVTGGSDFHGDITPKIHMGTGYGDLFVPYDSYLSLVNYQPAACTES